MRPRMTSPALSVPGAGEALQALSKAANAAINAWNRLNIVSGQVAGEWTARWVA